MAGIQRKDYLRLLIVPVAFTSASLLLWLLFISRPALKSGTSPVSSSTFYTGLHICYVLDIHDIFNDLLFHVQSSHKIYPYIDVIEYTNMDLENVSEGISPVSVYFDLCIVRT